MAAESEHKEQVALFRWAEFAAARRPELRLLYAIPNGGHRHKAVAARMKAEGVRRGVLDICLPVARAPHHGLYIEMKTRRGRVSPDQRRWIAALRAQGYRAEVCRDWSEARQVIEQHLDGGERGPRPFGNNAAPGEGETHERGQ
jgi:hypothetical protein